MPVFPDCISIFGSTSLKILFRTMISQKKILETQKNFFCIMYFDTTIRNTKTGNRTPDHRGNFMCKLISKSKEICLHKNFFDITILSTKTGNRTENRTPDQPEIFMDELVCQYKFECIGIFSIGLTVIKILNLCLLMSFSSQLSLVIDLAKINLRDQKLKANLNFRKEMLSVVSNKKFSSVEQV